MTYVLSIAAVCGALAVYLILPHRHSTAKLGGLLAAAVLGLTLAWIAGHTGREAWPSIYYYVFTAIAAASAIRVISHPRPVYAALYFVMVVLSTSGMLVLLEAEFMAFAMVIIYAGAILVTYMFVIMLATMPQSSSEPDTSPTYDRTAREPMAAVVMGFTLLAVIANIAFDPVAEPLPRNYPAPLHASLTDMGRLTDVSDPHHRRRVTDALRELGLIEIGERVYAVDMAANRIDVRTAEGVRPKFVPINDRVLAAIVPNMDQVGLNLFKGHTLGIELAAVILLLSMVGAIVIAKRTVLEAHGMVEG